MKTDAEATVILNERQAAKRLGVSVATLRRRRLLRRPPIYAKIGNRVIYRETDLLSFIDANLVKPTGQGSNEAR